MDEQPQTSYRFEVGDIVAHRRYGYRGVVFERDPVCRADEEWYQSNQTQPPREQPWYHVLVDGAAHSTYVAQSNLEADPGGERVFHPLLGRYFQSYYQKRYHSEPLN